MQDACHTVAGVMILLMQHGKGCCSAVVSFCKVTSHKAVGGEEGTGTCFTAIGKGRSDRSASCPTASSLGKCQVVAGGKEQLQGLWEGRHPWRSQRSPKGILGMESQKETQGSLATNWGLDRGARERIPQWPEHRVPSSFF